MTDEQRTLFAQAVRRTKFSCYINIVFGVMLIFVMIGIVMGKQLAVLMAIILTLGWAMTQIMQNAFHAFTVLKSLKNHNPGDDEK
jgi:hypothetical protein